MAYRLAADGVLLLHLGFILFALLGGLLVLWRRFWLWLHLPAVVWAIYIELTGGICPLTPLENYLRKRGGEVGYDNSFIERYLVPLIYPEGLTQDIQWLLAAVVLLLNLVIYGFLVYRKSGD